MGCVPTIDFDKFPKQGPWLNRVVEVCFNFDASKHISGQIIRDDAEAPFLTIIRLVDGRHILATECQYHPV